MDYLKTTVKKESVPSTAAKEEEENVEVVRERLNVISRYCL